MAADSHEHDGPVIASSNRYDDLAPYCGRIYAVEPFKWREVMPWDFPQSASKDDEEAFLRKFFTEREIYIQGGVPYGYKFLKQVWYCIAMWNAQVKVPMIAEQWMREMGNTAADPAMTGYIMAEEAELKTFFMKQEIDRYGERLLGVAVKHIQYLVSTAKQKSATDQVTESLAHVSGAAQAGAKSLSDDAASHTGAFNRADDIANKDVKCGTGSLQPAGHDVTMSARVEKVGLALSDHSTSSEFTDPGHVGRPRAGSTVDFGSNAPLPPQSRKRGNSNAMPHNVRYVSDQRYEQLRNDAFFSSPHQQWPQSNMAAPSIGSDRSFSNVQPYPLHDQMRTHPAHAQDPFQQLNGPPPSGMYGQGMAQQAGPPGLLFDERNFKPSPSGYRGSHYQQQLPVYYSNSQLNDRTNDHSFDNQFNNGMHVGENMYAAKRGGKQHDSNALRSSRPRGYSNSGRGKGSQGNRNSFTGSRPQNDFHAGTTGARQSSADQGMTQGSGGGYANRRTSAASNNWVQNANQAQYRPKENTQPTRAFSGPDVRNPPPSVYWAPSSGNTGLPPRRPAHGPFEPGFRSPSDSHSSQQSTQQTPHNEYQHTPSVRPPPLDELVHDDKNSKAAQNPGKLVTEYHIGAECSHVRKLRLFAVPAFDGGSQWLGEFFERCGPVVSVRGFDNLKYKGPQSRDIWITFGDHFAAMKALRMDGQQLWPGMLLKIRVPKEYWDTAHDRYPGQWHPEDHFRQTYHRFSFQRSLSGNMSMDGSSVLPEPRDPVRDQHASGGSTPIAKAPTNATLHKELLSGSTTPTPSAGASSPKKKKQSKGKGKMKPLVPLEQAVADATEAMQKRTDSVRDASKAKDDADTTVPVDFSGDANTFHFPEMSDGSSTSMKAPDFISVDTTADSRGSVSTQSSEPAQTISEISITPVTELTARLPPFQKPGVVDAETKTNATQSFREPPVPTEEEAGEPGRVDVAVVATAEEEAGSPSQGGGEKVARQPASAAAKPVTDQAEAVTPKSTDMQPMKDEAYPATGTPHHVQQGKADRKRDRGSEESTASNDTGITASTDRIRSSTVIHRPETPIEAKSLNPSSTALPKNRQPATESAASSDTAAEPQNIDAASPIADSSGPDHSPSTTSPGSPPSTITASALKSFSKRIPVALPRVRIIEPRKSSGDSSIGLQVLKRTASGNSIPPTPAFVTAPSTPALPAKPAEPEKPESDAGEVAEHLNSSLKAAKTEEKPEKAEEKSEKAEEKPEKSKGPARTTSLLGGLFTKMPKQKPKKAKAQKGKGSIRGKPKMDEDVSSEAPSEDLLDRIMSGTMQLGEQADKRTSTLETKAKVAGKDASQQATKKRNDSKVSKSADASPSDRVEINKAASLQQSEEQHTTKPTSSDVSPVKPRGALGSLLSYLGSSISPQALTLETKAEEPSQQQNPTVEKSDILTAQGTELRPTTEAPADAKFDRVFTGLSELSDMAGLAPMDTAGSDKTFLGWPEQPFRSFHKDGLTYGACDGGDGGDGSAGEIGLGIMASLRPDLDAAAVNEEAKPKKKKKKKSNKKSKSKVSEQAHDDAADAGILTGATLLLAEDEREPGSGEFQFRFTANSEPAPGINPLQDTKSESTSQIVISETSSEASSRTLGRSTSHDHTPSSTAAASSTQGSPSRLQNMIRKQNDGVIVPAPNRTLMLRRRNNLNARTASSASKTAESEGSSPVGTNKSEKGKTVWVDEDPMSSSSDDDEADVSGKSLDKMLDQVQRHSMKQSRPMLYLYVGGGRQEKKDEEEKTKGRVEEVKDDFEGEPDFDEEKLEKVAKRRFLTVGVKKS